MKLKTTVAAVVLGLGFAAAANAQVLGDSLGTLSSTNTFLGPTATGGQANNFYTASGNFANIHTFTVGDDLLNGSYGAEVGFSWVFGAMYDIGSVYAQVYTGTYLDYVTGNATLVSSFNHNDIQILGDTKVLESTFALTQSEYVLVLGGTVSGWNGGFYNIGVGVTAVPEPEAYAMMLAGLGMVGAMVRRRRKS
ncbi:MAG: FxDxF family PEP-CTERM protein [Azoarcus sp.]|jgi:hypothetical protein|nr:FxDxF family PEP-CTERM protein [Azoarcus sp.]